jgi:hypothetical protein
MNEGLLDRARFGRIHFHATEAHAELEKSALSTKHNTYLTFLEYLFDLGSQTADAWLADKGPAIGQGSTSRTPRRHRRSRGISDLRDSFGEALPDVLGRVQLNPADDLRARQPGDAAGAAGLR